MLLPESSEMPCKGTASDNDHVIVVFHGFLSLRHSYLGFDSPN
jgi:hypothetical protein